MAVPPTVPLLADAAAAVTTSLQQRWRNRRRSVNAVLDNVVFAFSGVAALWLAWLVLSETFSLRWLFVPYFLLFWLILAYLVLPRLHRILTRIYVPDYFIGRARTSDGLLGDPINLALKGSEQQLHEAMTRAGWIRADDVTLASSWRIVTSTVLRRSYDEAPVSPLLLFGTQQDLAYQQEVEGNPAKRHHVRFWRCPEGWYLPGGHHADWLAAGTFDKAVGFSLFTLQITHKIDANTDVERDHIVASLAAPDITVHTLVDFSTGYHCRNGGGDTIETDGDLPVVDVRQVVVPADGVPLGPDLDRRRAVRAARRPISTALGAVLMAARVVVGAATAVFLLLDRHQIVAQATAEGAGEDAPTVDGVVIGLAVVLAVAVVLYLALTVQVLRGSNGARITAMLISVLLVLGSATDVLSGGSVSLGANAFGLPLDILVLLALSARSSRLWARRTAVVPVT